MASLKDRLRAELTASMKARDELRSSTLRMVLTAITNAEVSGKQARVLSDGDKESRERSELAAYDPGLRDVALLVRKLNLGRDTHWQRKNKR